MAEEERTEDVKKDRRERRQREWNIRAENERETKGDNRGEWNTGRDGRVNGIVGIEMLG